MAIMTGFDKTTENQSKSFDPSDAQFSITQ